MSYTIEFYRSGVLYDLAIMEVTEKDVLSTLEDTLYILQELTPVKRNWKDSLMTFGAAAFEYCDNIAFVSYCEHTRTFSVLE